VYSLSDVALFDAGFVVVVLGALLILVGLLLVGSQTGKLRNFTSGQDKVIDSSKLDSLLKTINKVIRINGYAMVSLLLGLLAIVGGLLVMVRSTWPTL